MATINVSIIRQTATAKGIIEVFCNTRETKGKTIDPANKLRSILIPELDLSALPSKFVVPVTGMFYDLARQQLAGLWKDNSALREVDSALFTVDGLLAYAARESESKRLTGDSIKVAAKEFISSLKQESQETATKILINMAAPGDRRNEGTEKQCFALASKLQEWIELDDENENPILVTVHERILARAEGLKKAREDYALETVESF